MKFWLLLAFYLLSQWGFTQPLTYLNEKGKEFFNGDERIIREYLETNQHLLDPIEGIWTFTKIEYNQWGLEVCRTNNVSTSAFIRDCNNPNRDFIEVNLSGKSLPAYRVVYNINGSGNFLYPSVPTYGIGLLFPTTNYEYNSLYKVLVRDAGTSFGCGLVNPNNPPVSAKLVGQRIFPQAEPSLGLFTYPWQQNNITSPCQQLTPPKTPPIQRRVASVPGWEPIVEWNGEIFPSHLLSMATNSPEQFRHSFNYKGDPFGVLGVAIINRYSGKPVRIEIDATPFSQAVNETFVLERKGAQYQLFPKVRWDYAKLRELKITTPLNLTYRIYANNKLIGSQIVTATLHSINDCPLVAPDFSGYPINLSVLFAAYVNEEHPVIDRLLAEVLKQNIVGAFTGYQSGQDEVIRQVYAIWHTLQQKGIRYSNIAESAYSFNNNVLSQRVRLIEESLQNTQANCIDGTVLFASILKAIDIDPVIVIVPGHAYLGYYADPSHRNLQLLETTLLGNTEINAEKIPVLPCLKTVKNQGSSKSFTKATLMGQENHQQALAIGEDKVGLIDLAEVRNIIKPLGK
ncbi:MAG: hypothetical protein KDD02_16530 [Phaeodactylibacter sp.]|nr:hypothetical protein [Phaeodactylibacter sp.]